jgi:histidinol-phosphate phosphatase family protein
MVRGVIFPWLGRWPFTAILKTNVLLRRLVPKKGSDKVLFLDRDGVINEHVWPAPRSWRKFEFLPGVLDALADATKDGWRIVVVTNKGSVGLRYISPRVSAQINAMMVGELAKAGANIERVYACNHVPHGLCECRKPKPGMLERARRELDLRPKVCWMVGDNATDVAAGVRSGCRTVLLLTTKSRDRLESRLRRLEVQPDAWAADLAEAWRDVIKDSA